MNMVPIVPNRLSLESAAFHRFPLYFGRSYEGPKAVSCTSRAYPEAIRVR